MQGVSNKVRTREGSVGRTHRCRVREDPQVQGVSNKVRTVEMSLPFQRPLNYTTTSILRPIYVIFKF